MGASKVDYGPGVISHIDMIFMSLDVVESGLAGLGEGHKINLTIRKRPLFARNLTLAAKGFLFAVS